MHQSLSHHTDHSLQRKARVERVDIISVQVDFLPYPLLNSTTFQLFDMNRKLHPLILICHIKSNCTLYRSIWFLNLTIYRFFKFPAFTILRSHHLQLVLVHDHRSGCRDSHRIATATFCE